MCVHLVVGHGVLLLNARTQPSFDQTDDGVDAETSLSLSLCVSISLLRPYTFFSRSPLVFKTLFESSAGQTSTRTSWWSCLVLTVDGCTSWWSCLVLAVDGSTEAQSFSLAGDESFANWRKCGKVASNAMNEISFYRRLRYQRCKNLLREENGPSFSETQINTSTLLPQNVRCWLEINRK